MDVLDCCMCRCIGVLCIGVVRGSVSLCVGVCVFDVLVDSWIRGCVECGSGGFDVLADWLTSVSVYWCMGALGALMVCVGVLGVLVSWFNGVFGDRLYSWIVELVRFGCFGCIWFVIYLRFCALVYVWIGVLLWIWCMECIWCFVILLCWSIGVLT